MQIAQKTVGGVFLPGAAIIIGAGACKIYHAAAQWLPVAPVILGSITPQPRPGNIGNNLFYPQSLDELLSLGCGLNWFGMPNVGFEAVLQKTGEHSPITNPLMISIAGFSVSDYVLGNVGFQRIPGTVAIELNFGCPNTEHGKIVSFDLKSIDMILAGIRNEGGPKPIWLKFSPYSDPGLLAEVAAIVNGYTDIVKAVTTCNTFPNAFMGKGTLSSPDALAGLSGPAMKSIALGQVVQFKKHLKPSVDVWGIGGITTGNDVVDFFEAGADGVQLTSLPFWLGSPKQFWEHLMHPQTGNRLAQLIEA